MFTIPRDLRARFSLSMSHSLTSNATDGDCPSGTLRGRNWIVGADDVRITTLMCDCLSADEKVMPQI